MRRAVIVLAVLLASAVWSATPAVGAPCTTSTTSVRATRWVRVPLRRHGHVVYRRVHSKRRRVMVRKLVHYVKHVQHVNCEAAAAPAPAPGAPVRQLKAHIDPSFVRDPADPLKVTYSYSASATLTSAPAAAATPAELPEGVLDLYSDGSLACSINVGGPNTGGQCPVAYTATGAHTVVVTFESGPTTVTETSTETIEPYPTTTKVGVAYEPSGVNTLENCVGGGRCLWTIGLLKLTTAVRDGELVPPGAALLEPPFIDGTRASSHTFQVTAETECVVNGSERRIVVVGVILHDETMVVLTPAQVEQGTVEASATYAGAPGWAPSAGSAPVKFTPSLSAVYKNRNGEYVGNGCT